MRTYVISVKDSAAQAYMSPAFYPSTGVAVRAFRDEVNREAPDNMLNKHPADFELFLLGEFDPETATFELTAPKSLLRGVDCVVPKE